MNEKYHFVVLIFFALPLMVAFATVVSMIQVKQSCFAITSQASLDKQKASFSSGLFNISPACDERFAYCIYILWAGLSSKTH
jgi:hypothetical protein